MYSITKRNRNIDVAGHPELTDRIDELKVSGGKHGDLFTTSREGQESEVQALLRLKTLVSDKIDEYIKDIDNYKLKSLDLTMTSHLEVTVDNKSDKDIIEFKGSIEEKYKVLKDLMNYDDIVRGKYLNIAHVRKWLSDDQIRVYYEDTPNLVYTLLKLKNDQEDLSTMSRRI